MDVPDWLAHASRICVLTGAGISTDSGIPDYRGPNGVWTKDPDAEKLVTLSWYLRDPEIRRRSWLLRRELAAARVTPNAGHAALVDLERQGRLRALLTQNIDGLHQAAGSSPGVVLELHGTVHAVECTDCGDRTPMVDALARVADGEPDPACRVCGGVLKSATVYFGQALDAGVLSINSNTSVRVSTPFGGFKQSGYGRELGPHAVEAYTEEKSIFYSTEG